MYNKEITLLKRHDENPTPDKEHIRHLILKKI